MQFDKVTYSDLDEIKGLQPDGWPDITNEFRLYLKNDFCYPIKASIAGKIVGLGNSMIFMNTAWIAHIIVSTEYRNRGIGFQIVDKLLTDIKRKSVESVLLIATELGEPVYKKAGFRLVSDYLFLIRGDDWNETFISENIVPYTNVYYNEIINLDKFISGEIREPLIRSYLKNSLIYLDSNSLRGFYLPDLGDGLIFADNPAVGIELMKVKYSRVDTAVIPSENKVGIDFLKQNGFKVSETKGRRMILGKDISWKPEYYFSRIGGNYG